MYVRLAFAVAAHLEPDILIVDEVLAVGDAEFQKKCLGKMKDVSDREGRTVLFVSHDMQAISTLTDTCIYLENGSIHSSGPTNDIINNYINNSRNKEIIYIATEKSDIPKITRVELLTTLPNNVHHNGEDLSIKIKVIVPFAIRSAWLAIQINDNKERNYIQVSISNTEMPLFDHAGDYEVIATLPKCKLFMGKYFINIYIAEPPGGQIFESLLQICPFEIVMFNNYREYPWREGECAYIENSAWKISKI